MTIIKTENLTKKYGRSYAVKNLNLEIEKGEVFGFLGPNGAGKTTTIAMLTGILRPTSGCLYLFGKEFNSDYFNLKRRIGVVPEYPSVYKKMSAYAYLSFFADMYQVKNKEEKIGELLELVELEEYKDKPLKEFSKGMRQRVSIARALINDPEILFLDEPMHGLDPMGVKDVRDIILNQKEKGKTILISSHILSEVERVCDVIGIIKEGELVTKGSIDELERVIGGGMELEIELDKSTVLDRTIGTITQSLRDLDFVDKIETDNNKLKIRTNGLKEHRREISERISKEGGIIIGMKKNRIDLEDIFVEATKNG